MKSRTLFLISIFLIAPSFSFGACSVANLTRCLDSVCAINIGANPAARCQYCGSSSAGEPTKSTAMKSVSAGSSAKYAISDKELKKAPTEPGARYVWATQQCLAKVSGCSAEDVTDNYDSLIEQSCKAAGISAEMANLTKKANTTKTQSACSTAIEACVIDTKRCGANFKQCESDAIFDKQFSECGVLSTGCESFLSDIRANLLSSRDTAFKNADKILKSIVASYQTAREQKLADAKSGCQNNKAKAACVARVCQNNMRNKCEIKTGNDVSKGTSEAKSRQEMETTIANELCKFYDTACERLK